MAGKRPLFVSAPRLILGTMNSDAKFQRLAYAIGLNVRVSVNVQPIYCLGSYAPIALEAVQYQPVQGSLQIIRLQRQDYRDARIAGAKNYYKDSKLIDSSTIKSDVQSFDLNTNTSSQLEFQNQSNSLLEQNSIRKHLDPQQVLISETFDIRVYLNINGYGDQFAQSTNWETGQINSTTDKSVISDLVEFMTIKDCRITSRNVNITQGQLVNEPLNFMGLLAVSSTEALDTIIQETTIK